MLNQTQEKEIEKIFQEYQNDIKPLVYYIERKYHKFPLSLLNEIRDVFDHLSRCYCTNTDIENFNEKDYIDKNIEKAQNHFTRIKLDAYKYINDFKARDFKRWKRKYNKYDLQNINDGEFWKEILDLEYESEKLFVLARKMESIDIENAYDLFYQSTEKYEKIEELISNKQKLIVKAKFKYRRVTLFNNIVTFIIGIITGVLASIIYTNVIAPLF